MVAIHTIPFETSCVDHREEVSGCWPPRLVCGVWRDFRRIDHWCDGRAQIQSCWQASQDRVRGDVETSRLEGVLLWIHANHGAEGRHLEECPQEHLHFPRRGFADLIHSAHGWCISLSHDAPESILTQSGLAPFWTPYHDMAAITLGLFLESRLGNWLLHLPSSRALIQLWYAYDNMNYERLLTYNYAIMLRLPKWSPEGALTVNAKWFQCPVW